MPEPEFEYKEFMENTAKTAGEMALSYLGKAKVSYKAAKNAVTEADLAIDKFITGKIKETYPEHDIVSEEFSHPDTEAEYVWFIDPIDGTTNYSHGDHNFGISIALAKNGKVIAGCIYLPVLDHMYYAEENKGAYRNNEPVSVSENKDLYTSMIEMGISHKDEAVDDSLKLVKSLVVSADRARDSGFSVGQLASVALGSSEGYVKFSQHPWDIAAGIVIAKEAGGKITDMTGNEILLKGGKRFNIIVSNTHLHQELIDAVKKADLKIMSEENFDWY